jgi:beta-N-acetylhexosaminidase
MRALRRLRSPVALAATVAGVLCAGAGASAQGGGSAAPPAGAPPAVAPRLTAAQVVGQEMIYSYVGTRPPAGLERRIAAGEAAGVILFARNVASRSSLRATLRRLQAIRRPSALRAPLLVMIDQEGGLVKRLSGPPTRSPAALGRIGSAALARREGAATAGNLRSVGVNVDLAPVVDVGRPGSYQQRTERSYSSDPARVSRLARAFAAGLQDGGVAATLKHFPGLGLVRRDEDAVAQRVGLPLSTLRRIDEAPFAAGARAGVKLIMTSTAVYPALSRLPAMLSPLISTGELRGRVGFTGVSVTDDITVRAMVPYGTPASIGRRALRAGNDLLLYAGGYGFAARAADALVGDLRAGRLDRARMNASVERVLALRRSLR